MRLEENIPPVLARQTGPLSRAAACPTR
jgi:hypothetical protein